MGAERVQNLTFQHQGVLNIIKTEILNPLRHVFVDVIWRANKPIEVEYEEKILEYKNSQKSHMKNLSYKM